MTTKHNCKNLYPNYRITFDSEKSKWCLANMSPGFWQFICFVTHCPWCGKKLEKPPEERDRTLHIVELSNGNWATITRNYIAAHNSLLKWLKLDADTVMLTFQVPPKDRISLFPQQVL